MVLKSISLPIKIYLEYFLQEEDHQTLSIWTTLIVIQNQSSEKYIGSSEVKSAPEVEILKS